jgi:hypothetical protein
MSIPMIAVTNASTCLTDAQVEAVLPALQKQVTDDFRAYWNVDCTLSFLRPDLSLPHGWWQIALLDNPDQAGVLGYHELTAKGTPLGKVFAQLDLSSKTSWTVTLSHELLEMLVDPWTNWCAAGLDNKIYALEVADPVEADELGYEIDGILVSDFVTPSWFEPCGLDRVDFLQHISNPLEVAPGGYISIFDGKKGWTQIAAPGRPCPPVISGSRRSRRKMKRRLWRLSAF